MENDKELLLSRYFDQHVDADQEEMRLLADWLRESPSHIEQFVEDAYIHRSLYDLLKGQDTNKILSGLSDSGTSYDVDLWEALLQEERTAPSIEIEEKPEEPTPIVLKKVDSRRFGTPSKISLFVTLTTMAAMFLMLAYVRLNPKSASEPVATLVDAISPEWADSTGAIKPGTRLFTRQGSLQLKKGILKIQFDDGSDVIVEAPSEFEIITDDQIELRYGRVYTKVPEGVVGFIINTPNSKIIDLGTEFGVQVNVDGASEVHVMKGKISLVSGAGSNEGKSQIVRQGSAKRVEKNSDTVRDIPVAQTAFVQDISSRMNYVWRGQPIDLADMLGGGNGFGTGQTGISIDVETGEHTKRIAASGIQRSKPYTETPRLPYIDGVFIPDGEYGPVQVSSEGHVFENCPDTEGRTFYGPFTGAVLPLKTADEVFDYAVQNGGQRYGTAGRPIIFIHSNLGITFDLRGIRQSLPMGTWIDSFSALCGVGEGPVRSRRAHDYADFYVLVDGQERFRATDMEYQSGLRPVDLKLTADDRFLTLMTTDGSDHSVHLDWSFFAEPKLEIKKIEQK